MIITISGHDYEIEHANGLKDSGGVRLMGETSSEEGKIRLMSGLLKSIEQENIIHEIFHTRCNHAGLYPNARGLIKAEQVFDVLANGLLQMGFEPLIK